MITVDHKHGCVTHEKATQTAAQGHGHVRLGARTPSQVLFPPPALLLVTLFLLKRINF